MSVTTNVIRIDLPLSELTDRRNCAVKDCYLELYPKYMSYKCVAEYEELNQDTGIWESIKSNYRWTKRRDNICNVEMWRVRKEGKYCVAIECSGVADRDGWHWEDPKEALVVYEQLKNYMLYIE